MNLKNVLKIHVPIKNDTPILGKRHSSTLSSKSAESNNRSGQK